MNKLYRSIIAGTIAIIVSSVGYANDRAKLDMNGHTIHNPPPQWAVVSICGNGLYHIVKQGCYIKPSNDCRVINYYDGRLWKGVVKVPLSQPFMVPWYPNVTTPYIKG